MTTSRVPNLLIAGVTKAGTTALFGYLGQHPQICPERLQESSSFVDRDDEGEPEPLGEYGDQFAHCRDEKYLLKASPSYFGRGPRFVSAVRGTLREPRVLVTLREPVDRLWSSYKMKRSKGHFRAEVTFEDFVERCLAVRASGEVWRPENQVYRALSTGFYADYIDDWLDVFGDHLRVLFFEQWSADPAAALAGLCQWLRIDPQPTGGFDYSVRNRGVMHRSAVLRRIGSSVNRAGALFLRRRPRLKTALAGVYERVNAVEFADTMAPATRQGLQALYEEPNTRLANRLAARGYQQLPAWLGGAARQRSG
ncbi:sulfotransferase domain-containing protein [soil metagenome]